MNHALTEGQLSILHSLHDGDDPVLRAPDADLIYYVRDARLLTELGLIQPSGKSYVLTQDALEVLDALRGPPAERLAEPAPGRFEGTPGRPH